MPNWLLESKILDKKKSKLFLIEIFKNWRTSHRSLSLKKKRCSLHPKQQVIWLCGLELLLTHMVPFWSWSQRKSNLLRLRKSCQQLRKFLLRKKQLLRKYWVFWENLKKNIKLPRRKKKNWRKTWKGVLFNWTVLKNWSKDLVGRRSPGERRLFNGESKRKLSLETVFFALE